MRWVVYEGWRPATAAEAAGVSRATAYKWLRRYRAEGWPGLRDRSRRPRRSPGRLAAPAELRIAESRRRQKLGLHRLGAILGVQRSTCYAVLCRHRLQRLAWLDRPTGALMRRFERSAPGELLHVDAKKFGCIPPGGGHRALGRSTVTGHRKTQAIGSDFVRAVVDNHSRLAYAEVHVDERGETCAGFLARAVALFAGYGVGVQRVMTDNAKNCVLARSFQAALAADGA